MKYYYTTTNNGSEPVIVYAKSKEVVLALLNYDCEFVKSITATEAKQMIAKGLKLIK